MLNWTIDEKELEKSDPKKYKFWKLTQTINYGLDGVKIDKSELLKSWNLIKENLDPYKRRALEYFLWQKLYSLPNNLSFLSVSK